MKSLPLAVTCFLLAASAISAIHSPAEAYRTCNNEQAWRSPGSNQPVSAIFINHRNHPVDVYWINFQGQREKYFTVNPNEAHNQKTFAGHIWIATHRSGDCIGGWVFQTSGTFDIR